MTDVRKAKKNINLLQFISSDTQLKRVADTEGGEWCGPCPFCGGKDRFSVQPNHSEGGRWYCRGCGDNKWHDVIDYVQKRDGLEFIEALDKLAPEMDLNQQNQDGALNISESPNIDRSQYVDAALEFREDCISNLWSDKGKSALDWLHWRGLDNYALKQWAIGYNPIEGYGKPEEWGLHPDTKLWIPRGIVIPCQDGAGFHYLKIRRRVGEKKYVIIKGGEQWPFGLQTYHNVSTAFLMEGEFDVILAHQTGFTGVGYASLPAGQGIKLEYQPFFESVIDVIVAYDNDDPGQKAANNLCRLSRFYKANTFPEGKDLTEYAQVGGNVFEWLYQQVGLLNGGNDEA